MTLLVRATSSAVFPPFAPSAMAAPTVTPGAGQLLVGFSPPASDGGSAVLSYGVRRSLTGAGSWTESGGHPSSPVTLSGLVNGSTYDVQVRAINAVGAGPWSATSTGTPSNSFGIRSVAASSDPSGGLAVPAGAVAGDTLIFIASRTFKHGVTAIPPAGAVAVDGTPINLDGDWPSFYAWRILSWDGTTTSYSFGHDGWAGERAIVALNGAATAIDSTSMTSSSAQSVPWSQPVVTAGRLVLALAGAHNPANLPIVGVSPQWVERKAQGAGEWVGLGFWSRLQTVTEAINPMPGGVLTGAAGNSATQYLVVTP